MAAAAPLGSGSKRMSATYTLADFQAVGDLGQGSFGTVTKVVHKETGETFAMKVMEKVKVVEHELQEQLKREVLTHLKARHPNIVRMHYYFEDAARVHCLLELADRGQLFAYLRNFPKGLPEPKASRLFSDSAHGLAYLHSLGVAHRDVKPENILLFGEREEKDTPRAKLGDLGWCVALTVERPDRQTFCGTMDYLSPEMWKNEPHDHGVDLWALGVLLYEMVLARPPFAAKSAAEAMSLICAANPKLPEGSMSEGAKEIVVGLLQREKKDRTPLSRVVRHPWVATFAGSCTGGCGGGGHAQPARRGEGAGSGGLDDTCVIRRPGGGGASAAAPAAAMVPERKPADLIEETLRVRRPRAPPAELKRLDDQLGEGGAPLAAAAAAAAPPVSPEPADELGRTMRRGGSPPREGRGAAERRGEQPREFELRDRDLLSVVDNPSVPAEDFERLSVGLRAVPSEGSSARAPSPRSLRAQSSEEGGASSLRVSSPPRVEEGVRTWEDVQEPEQLQFRRRVGDAGPADLSQQRQWTQDPPRHLRDPYLRDGQDCFERPRHNGPPRREFDSRDWEQRRASEAAEGSGERERRRRASEHAAEVLRPGGPVGEWEPRERRRRSTQPPEEWGEQGYPRQASAEHHDGELPAPTQHGRGAGVCFPGPRRKPPPKEEPPEPSDEDEDEGTLTSAGTLVYEYLSASLSGFFAASPVAETPQYRQRAKVHSGGGFRA